MGLAVIVILVCAFGFLVYHKFDLRQRQLLARMQAVPAAPTNDGMIPKAHSEQSDIDPPHDHDPGHSFGPTHGRTAGELSPESHRPDDSLLFSDSSRRHSPAPQSAAEPHSADVSAHHPRTATSLPHHDSAVNAPAERTALNGGNVTTEPSTEELLASLAGRHSQRESATAAPVNAAPVNATPVNATPVNTVSLNSQSGTSDSPWPADDPFASAATAPASSAPSTSALLFSDDETASGDTRRTDGRRHSEHSHSLAEAIGPQRDDFEAFEKQPPAEPPSPEPSFADFGHNNGRTTAPSQHHERPHGANSTSLDPVASAERDADNFPPPNELFDNGNAVLPPATEIASADTPSAPHWERNAGTVRHETSDSNVGLGLPAELDNHPGNHHRADSDHRADGDHLAGNDHSGGSPAHKHNSGEPAFDGHSASNNSDGLLIAMLDSANQSEAATPKHHEQSFPPADDATLSDPRSRSTPNSPSPFDTADAGFATDHKTKHGGFESHPEEPGTHAAQGQKFGDVPSGFPAEQQHRLTVPNIVRADDPTNGRRPAGNVRSAGHRDSSGNKIQQVSAATEPCAVCEVQPDDTYWTISRRMYDTPRYFSALALYNQHRIPDPKKLRPGMKVLIPAPEVLHDRFPELFPETTSQGPLRTGYFLQPDGAPAYRVGERETLSEVSQKHLGRASRWMEIYRMNQSVLKDPNRLKPGTVLNLPSDATNIQTVP